MDKHSIQGEWQYPKCIHYAADEILRDEPPDSIAYRIEIVIAQVYHNMVKDALEPYKNAKKIETHQDSNVTRHINLSILCLFVPS